MRTSPREPGLRILFVVNVLAVGGSEVFLLRKIRKLQERGHYAALAFLEKKGETIEFYLREYLENEELYHLPDFQSFRPLLAELRINVVHTVQGHPHFLKLAKTHNPDITTVTSLTPGIWEADRKFNHRAYTDAAIVMSEEFIKIVKEDMRNPPERIVAIENGIDLNSFTAWPQNESIGESPLPINGNQKIILHVARVHPVKNIEDSLALAQRVCAARKDCVFVLAGRQNAHKDPEYFQQLKIRANKFSLNGRYLFLGERKDIRELLSIASCVICTTRSQEGSPNALLEAMAMAKPVLALQCRGISGVIQNGVTGFIEENVSDLAMRLNQILDDPVLAETMGRAARKYCAERFDLNDSVSKYERLYSQLLDEKNSRHRANSALLRPFLDLKQKFSRSSR